MARPDVPPRRQPSSAGSTETPGPATRPQTADVLGSAAPATYSGGMTVWHRSPFESSGLSELFDASPDLGAHTSVAAEAALLLGVASLIAAPFSVMFALSLGLAALGLVLRNGRSGDNQPTWRHR